MAKSLDTIEFKSFEYLMLSVCLPNHNVNVVVIYRPPASSTAVFLDEFMSLSAYLHTLKSDYLLLGDFNILIDTGSALTTKFNVILDSCNVRQQVHFPTHIHGHTLNLVITSSDCPRVSNVRSDSCISDHFGVILHLDCDSTPDSSPKKISFCQYHKINMASLREDLKCTAFVCATRQ